MKGKIFLFVLTIGFLFAFHQLLAHCDTENGPVITAAKEALKTNNVNLILIWVQPKDEAIIKEAFQKTIDVRKISPAAQQMVDNYFFETLVRIHRAGEGVAYTGLKDSSEVEAPIAAADGAIERNSLADVMQLLNDAISKGVNEKFKEAISRKNYDANNVNAGREYVESYVMFMHYVEAIYNAASRVETAHHEREDAAMEDTHSITPAVHDTEKPDHLTHILIISGTLLIIIVQIFLSRKKT
jgi:Family of unknown function (DUF6448)